MIVPSINEFAEHGQGLLVNLAQPDAGLTGVLPGFGPSGWPRARTRVRCCLHDLEFCHIRADVECVFPHSVVSGETSVLDMEGVIIRGTSYPWTTSAILNYDDDALR